MIWNYFDKAYVINLPHRTGRLQRITKRLNDQNIPFEVIEGIAPNDRGCYSNKGHNGAALSHLKIWEMISKQDIDNAIIFEDDALLRDDCSEIMEDKVVGQLKATNWDILYLGLYLVNKTNSNVSANLKKFLYGAHLHAYAVKKTCAAKMSKHIRLIARSGNQTPIDGLMNKLTYLVKLHTVPLLAVQEPSLSDTGGGIRLDEYFSKFNEQEFLDNCRELKLWKTNSNEIYK